MGECSDRPSIEFEFLRRMRFKTRLECIKHFDCSHRIWCRGDRRIDQGHGEGVQAHRRLHEPNALTSTLRRLEMIPRPTEHHRINECVRIVIHRPCHRLMKHHRTPAADIVIVPARVHGGHLVATRRVLPSATTKTSGRRVVLHDHDRAMSRLARGRCGNSTDPIRPGTDVAHRATDPTVLPHHLDGAIAEGKRRHASRGLHVELLRDAADVFAIRSEFSLVAILGPDLLAFPERLVVCGQHHQNWPRGVKRESWPHSIGPGKIMEVIANEPRH